MKSYKELFKEAFEDLKHKGRRKKQIPNILTSMRLLAPFFIIPSAFIGNIPLLLTFIGLFSITDMVDGLIARKFSLTSDLGKDLDAFADKIFAGTLLIASSFMHLSMLIPLVLEGAIAGVNINAKLKDLEPKSLMVGKIKTCLLFPLIGVALIKELSFPGVFQSLFLATTLMQSASLVSYHNKYQKEIKRNSLVKEIEEASNTLDQEEKNEDLSKKLVLDSKRNKIEELKRYRNTLVGEEDTNKKIKQKKY